MPCSARRLLPWRAAEHQKSAIL